MLGKYFSVLIIEVFSWLDNSVLKRKMFFYNERFKKLKFKFLNLMYIWVGMRGNK